MTWKHDYKLPYATLTISHYELLVRSGVKYASGVPESISFVELVAALKLKDPARIEAAFYCVAQEARPNLRGLILVHVREDMAASRWEFGCVHPSGREFAHSETFPLVPVSSIKADPQLATSPSAEKVGEPFSLNTIVVDRRLRPGKQHAMFISGISKDAEGYFSYQCYWFGNDGRRVTREFRAEDLIRPDEALTEPEKVDGPLTTLDTTYGEPPLRKVVRENLLNAWNKMHAMTEKVRDELIESMGVPKAILEGQQHLSDPGDALLNCDMANTCTTCGQPVHKAGRTVCDICLVNERTEKTKEQQAYLERMDINEATFGSIPGTEPDKPTEKASETWRDRPPML